MENSKIVDLINKPILQHLAKWQYDPEYRAECKRKQEHEIALLELQQLLWATNGTVENSYDIDMTPYANMTTKELGETKERLHQEAISKMPRYSAEDLRRLLGCDQ